MDTHQPFNTIGEEGYLSLMEHILENGYKVNNERTGTGTIVSPTPHQLYFPNVKNKFPLITTKEVSFNMLACEMLWFISGSTNANNIREIGSDAMADQWNKWADNDGELGPVYPKQWRKWAKPDHNNLGEFLGTTYIDQLQNVIDNIKDNAESRRHIVSAWNPAELSAMNLPPCHLMYQFTAQPLTMDERLKLSPHSYGVKYSDNIPEQLDELQVPEYKLHLHMLQRSCDMFLGVPFNISEYALLLLLVSSVLDWRFYPGDFTWTGVNCHIYQDHFEAVKEQLSRVPRQTPDVYVAEHIDDIDYFVRSDIELNGYKPHDKIKAPVSV